MNVIIFTIRNPGNIYLANRVSEEFNVAGMVVLSSIRRNRKQKLDYWMGMVKRYGFFKTINKYLYIKLPRKIEDPALIAKSFFYPDQEEIDYDFQTDVFYTYNINSAEVADFIKSKSCDVIAVCGSNLIKPEIFTLPKKGTINIHAGITPDYRCANPVEWALYYKDFDKVGVTIHFVDQGLDTGDVIYQQKAGVEKGDTITSLYCKNIINGAELMVKALKDIEAGKVKAKPLPADTGRHLLSIEFGYLQSRIVNNTLKSL